MGNQGRRVSAAVSRAWHWLYVFPRLALGACCMFSPLRLCSAVMTWRVFPRSGLVYLCILSLDWLLHANLYYGIGLTRAL